MLVHRLLYQLGKLKPHSRIVSHQFDAAHQFEIELIRSLHSSGRELTISMEMFDRDKQGVLNDYLAKRIDEAEFVKQSNVWPKYATSYRPVIEFAKRNNIDVIAANLPKLLAMRVAHGQPIFQHEEFYATRSTSASKGRYWMQFSEKLKSVDQNGNADKAGGHKGASEETIEQLFRAQCLKDDTMAESIVTYRQMHRHRKPLIVHLSGILHVELGLGLPARILSRAPLLRLCVITMEKHPAGTKPSYAEQSHFLVHLH